MPLPSRETASYRGPGGPPTVDRAVLPWRPEPFPLTDYDPTPLLPRLDRLAEERWADNWNFRAYLRAHQAPADVDRAVQRLNAAIAPQVDCTRCANCCKQMSPHLTDADVERLAARLELTPRALVARHLEPDERGEQVFRRTPCPLLQGTRCGVYEARPEDCASYPHLAKPDFLAQSIATIESYRVCPIVYHVYEALKGAFPYDPATDYIGDVDQEA
jgi:Fe-S-cluster containining protein